jgi:hypothetical protein
LFNGLAISANKISLWRAAGIVDFEDQLMPIRVSSLFPMICFLSSRACSFWHNK